MNKSNHQYETPLKLRRTSDCAMTLTEKSKVYLQDKNGHSVKDIANDIERAPSTISKFLKKSKAKKLFEPLHENKGRYEKDSTILSERQKNLLEKWLRNGEARSSHEAWIRLCKMKNTKKVCFNVVNNYIKTLGQWRNPLLKTVLSASNKEKRLSHCQKQINVNFKNILFTDESLFQLNANTLKVFWFRGTSPPTITKYNPNYTCMVWAGICHYGKTPLSFIEGWMNSEGYQKLLIDQKKEIKKLFRRKKWQFQQDNARCHTTEGSIKCIKRNLTKNLFPHPPQSPDLNPIELVWARMKRLVQLSRPRNKRQLRTSVERAWKQIKLQFIRNCIGGLRGRMEKVIEKKGDFC